MEALAAELPGQPLGYVAINETAAHRAVGMHRLLRLPQAQVGLTAPSTSLDIRVSTLSAAPWDSAVVTAGAVQMSKDQLLTTVSSKALVALRNTGVLCATVRTTLASSLMQPQLRRRHVQVIGMHHAMASAAATAVAHATGKAVHIWTCNTAAMMHAALEARADALVTDVPHQLLQVKVPQIPQNG